MKGRFLLNIGLIILGLIIGVIGAVYYSGYRGSGAKSEASQQAGKKEKKIIYWQSPMNPTYIRDEPGKSPMGMDLVPVYEGEEEASEPGTIKIDPVTIQNIGVRTDVVKRMILKKNIRTIGRVDYDETMLYHVQTKVNGWVERLYIDFTGQKVRKGDTLLEIYSPELVSTQEEYLLAYNAAKETKGSPYKSVSGGMDSLLKAARERLIYWDISDDQIKRLKETGEITKTMNLHSPNSGIVVKKHVKEGMYVTAGMNLYAVADISKVWVYADIYEYEIPWVKVGQKAEMTLASYPGEIFKGEVSFIYPFMEAKTRTNKVRLVFDNPKFKIKPDMYANVILKPVISKSAVAVPSEAIIRSGERNIVMISRGEGKFAPRVITLGSEAEKGFYEVKAGLDEGEVVVISAQFLIDSESKLKEAITKMLEVKKDASEKSAPGMIGMDRKSMGEEKKMDRSGMEGMKGMDQKKMNHGAMEGMDNESMDHGSMKMDGM